VNPPVSLLTAVRTVLLQARAMYRDHPPTEQWLTHHLDRLHEPLRVAVAGKVKAGKSTLLNALVGERIAPTDAGECTRVVTWYRDGRHPRIVLYPHAGPPIPLPVDRRNGALRIDLGHVPVDAVHHLMVDWPAQSLRTATLVDTPGIESLSTESGRRTWDFLDPDEDTPTEADAVIYLMRHLHATDGSFLESFRDQGVARAASVNTIAVVSRADEVAGGRVDAMFSARAIAARYRDEPALRGLCQNVVAVAGLLAQTGRTLKHAEFATLRDLAAGPRELLDRLGLYGVRLSVALIRQGAGDAAALATELVARSGLLELQEVLQTQFTERRDLLKARSALAALESLLRRDVPERTAPLSREVERILAGAHEFSELRLLSALRSGAVRLPDAMVEEAERLLGDRGAAPATRLGLPGGADPGLLRHTGVRALQRWQGHAENPMLGRAEADACRVVVRTCEGLLAAYR